MSVQRLLLAFVALCVLVQNEANSIRNSPRIGGGNCQSYQFQCKNGDCISREALCDGLADCIDGSDETSEECEGPDAPECNPRTFRCNYGACVDGDAPCNGIKDCADNSDETLPRCSQQGHHHQGNSSYGGGCRSDQFRCKTNPPRCIETTELCDGRIDCPDKSDETPEACGSFNCPQYVFRCAYGACIDQRLKCNGEPNCADGSDEYPILCDNLNPRPPTQRPSQNNNNPYITDVPRPTQRPPQNNNNPYITDVPRPTQSRPTPRPTQGRPSQRPTQRPPQTPRPSYPEERNGCYLPRYPENGRWLLKSGQCSNSYSCREGDEVPAGSQLSFECDRGYRVNGTADAFCVLHGEWSIQPKCIECGVAASGSGRPLIVNGSTPDVAEFPWHATLYKVKENRKDFICGATIIKENLLITAAHCVYNEAHKRIDNPNNFYVATGNIFKDYDSPLHDGGLVQKSRVKNIFIGCRYLGLTGNYESDIAILIITTSFEFSSVTLPICLDTGSLNDNAVLSDGNFGKVAGFGRTATGDSSSVLQTLTVPFIPLNTCRSSATASGSERYLTIDKFCAGYNNGSSVCDGDSGGGLVFETDRRWYLRGIVSLGIGGKDSGGQRVCDSNTYSLYTSVASHMEWLQDMILSLETKRPYPLCS